MQTLKSALSSRGISQARLRDMAWAALPPAVWSLVYGLLWLRPRLFSLSYNHLDPSYIYGVQLAAQQHEAFGQQFVSNYGPLSYAISNFLPSRLVGLTLWHVAAVLAVGFGAYWFCRLYVAEGWTRPLAGGLLLFTLALAGPEWLYLDLFILYAFIYLKLGPGQPAKQRLLIGLVTASVLFALMKFTIGLVSIGGVGLLILTEAVPGREALRSRLWLLVKIGLSYIVALAALGYMLGVKNIVAYAMASFQVASGFSGAMGINDPNLALALHYIIALFAVLAVWLVWKFRRDWRYYAFLIPAFYVVFKYCVTRQDGHVMAILQVVLVLAVMIYFLRSKIQPVDGVFLGVVLGLSMLSLWTNYIDFRQVNIALIAPISNIKEGQAVQFLRLGHQKQRWHVETTAWLKDARLPASMRQEIGTAGVDVFPWETVLVQANNLHWQNRPSPFSFETYTPTLDKMNDDFIKTKGPAFIVWQRFDESGALGVDGRHLLWDGPQSMGSILRYYRVTQSDEHFVLLKRQVKPAPVSHKVLASTQHGNEWTTVPANAGLVCAQIHIASTHRQDLYKALLRERPFFVEAQYADGITRQFRFVRETAPAGLVVNPLPYNWPSLVNVLRGQPTADTTVARIRIANEPTAQITFMPCHD